jgi:hypothetical protein
MPQNIAKTPDRRGRNATVIKEEEGLPGRRQSSFLIGSLKSS